MTNALVREREHAAVGVMDDHDLLRPEQGLADGEAAERVGDPAARVPDHVSVALGEPERARRVESSVLQARPPPCGSGATQPAFSKVSA